MNALMIKVNRPRVMIAYAAGTYTITLTVTDNGGAAGAQSKSLTVIQPSMQGMSFAVLLVVIGYLLTALRSVHGDAGPVAVCVGVVVVWELLAPGEARTKEPRKTFCSPLQNCQHGASM
jgi:hypothetical protein